MFCLQLQFPRSLLFVYTKSDFVAVADGVFVVVAAAKQTFSFLINFYAALSFRVCLVYRIFFGLFCNFVHVLVHGLFAIVWAV